MPNENERNRKARAAAEHALVRVVHHYGSRPEFVLIGGLVPELLCAGSSFVHAGTTDVDVQVNLEIQKGAVNVAKLERALLNAEFEPDKDNIWRWKTHEGGSPTLVKFELLADLESEPAQATVRFEECAALGAVNLRGTGFASRDVVVHTISSRRGGDTQKAEINVSGLAGFLLAKASAAHSRHLPKDWYDIAFVLLHNDAGGPKQAAEKVALAFPGELVGSTRRALDELFANFADPSVQGPQAYATQFLIDHPDADRATTLADAVTAVQIFCRTLFPVV
jgi:hypothetical protein